MPPITEVRPRPPKPSPGKPPVVGAAPASLPLWTNAGHLAAFLSPALAYSSPMVGITTAPVNVTDRVTLTPQAFPDTVTNQANDSTFAWWVSGENQKALVSVEAPLPAIGGSTAPTWLRRRAARALSDASILPRWA